MHCNAPVAQLDRVLPSEGRGRTFESSRARHRVFSRHCRRHGFSEASYYLWRGKFGGLSVSEARRLKALEAENAKLKKLLAEAMLEREVTREVLRKKW